MYLPSLTLYPPFPQCPTRTCLFLMRAQEKDHVPRMTMTNGLLQEKGWRVLYEHQTPIETPIDIVWADYDYDYDYPCLEETNIPRCLTLGASLTQ